MDTWDRFHRRWELLQSQDIADNRQAVSALALEVIEQQKFLLYLTAKLALGERVTPDDPVVRAFLELGKDDDARHALLDIVSRLQHAHAPRVVTCPKCGAGVRDVQGVYDEKCQFCGATVRTAT